MFIVKVPDKFVKADGKPWIKEKEVDGGPVRMLDQEGKPIVLALTPKGEPIYRNETEHASYLDTLTIFINNVFNLVAAKARENKEIKTLTMEDSAFATDLFRAIHVSNGTLELEKAPHEWLKAKLTLYGIDMFGVNAATVLEPLKQAEEAAPGRAEAKRQARAGKE